MAYTLVPYTSEVPPLLSCALFDATVPAAAQAGMEAGFTITIHSQAAVVAEFFDPTAVEFDDC